MGLETDDLSGLFTCILYVITRVLVRGSHKGYLMTDSRAWSDEGRGHQGNAQGFHNLERQEAESSTEPPKEQPASTVNFTQ
jgi:hypothetical protein